MEWLNHFSLEIQAFSVLFMLLLTAVLVWIARQCVAATDAVQEPCVTIHVKPHDPETAPGPSTASQAARPSTVVLLNIGVGPALNVKFRFDQSDVPQGGSEKLKVKSLPFLRAGGSVEIGIEKDVHEGERFRFSATYESLGRKRYLTVINMKNRFVESWSHRKARYRHSAQRHGAESKV